MKKCFRLAGCCLSFLTLVGLVFYIIMMVNLFSTGVSWLTGFFLIYGLVSMVVIGPMLSSLFFSEACRIERLYDYGCCEKCHRE